MNEKVIILQHAAYLRKECRKLIETVPGAHLTDMNK